MNNPQKKLAEELDRIAARYESQFAGMPAQQPKPRRARRDPHRDQEPARAHRVDPRSRAPTGARRASPRPRAQTWRSTSASASSSSTRRASAPAIRALRRARHVREFRLRALPSSLRGQVPEHARPRPARRDDRGSRVDRRRHGRRDEGVEEQPPSSIAISISVRSSSKTYREERGHIADARRIGTPEEQAQPARDRRELPVPPLPDALRGEIARDAAARAARSRRRRSSARVLGAMRALKKGGLSTGNNDGNIGIVERQIETYKTELDAVRAGAQGHRVRRFCSACSAAPRTTSSTRSGPSSPARSARRATSTSSRPSATSSATSAARCSRSAAPKQSASNDSEHRHRLDPARELRAGVGSGFTRKEVSGRHPRTKGRYFACHIFVRT